MSSEKPPAPDARCPKCQEALAVDTVRTAIWHGDRVAIVEDIPAHVCRACMEQFYDDDVSDALRALMEAGFPPEAAEKEISVPVFSLKGRIRKRQELPDDVYIE